MSEHAAALAHALGLHADDLADCQETIETPDGVGPYYVQDTEPADRDTAFYAVVDGKRYLVQVTEA